MRRVCLHERAEDKVAGGDLKVLHMQTEAIQRVSQALPIGAVQAECSTVLPSSFMSPRRGLQGCHKQATDEKLLPTCNERR